MDELRILLQRKLKKDQRGIRWFYTNYIESPINPNYTTTYHQIKGYISTLPDNLVSAINKYLKD